MRAVGPHGERQQSGRGQSDRPEQRLTKGPRRDRDERWVTRGDPGRDRGAPLARELTGQPADEHDADRANERLRDLDARRHPGRDTAAAAYEREKRGIARRAIELILRTLEQGGVVHETASR